MKSCSNCGLSVEPEAKVCSNCGKALSAVWPPPPQGQNPSAFMPPDKLMTGKVWGDIVVGFLGGGLITYFGSFFCGMGLIGSILGYFESRRTHPVFARAFGYGLLLGIAAFGFYFWTNCLTSSWPPGHHSHHTIHYGHHP